VNEPGERGPAAFLGKVSWHARQKLPTLFRSTRSGYSCARRGVTSDRQSMYYYQRPGRPTKLASFPVRFHADEGESCDGEAQVDGRRRGVCRRCGYGADVRRGPARTEQAAAGTPYCHGGGRWRRRSLANGVFERAATGRSSPSGVRLTGRAGGLRATVRIGPNVSHVGADGPARRSGGVQRGDSRAAGDEHGHSLLRRGRCRRRLRSRGTRRAQLRVGERQAGRGASRGSAARATPQSQRWAQ